VGSSALGSALRNRQVALGTAPNGRPDCDQTAAAASMAAACSLPRAAALSRAAHAAADGTPPTLIHRRLAAARRIAARAVERT
jgi:hypothetical protein